VVGAGAGGELAVWLLQKSEFSSAFSIAGYVDDDYRKQNAQMAGYPILGTTKDIPNLVQEHHIGLILFIDLVQHLKNQPIQPKSNPAFMSTDQRPCDRDTGFDRYIENA